MRIVFSIACRPRVYHRTDCPHVSRIKPRNRAEGKTENIPTAIRKGKYRPCKYCDGKEGAARCITWNLRKKRAAKKWHVYYREETDQFFLRTGKGFWKMVFKEDRYVLYHLNANDFNASKPDIVLEQGGFHFQSDVKPAPELCQLVEYAVRHDKAKKTIENDYRYLPRNTKRQRGYYQKAK